MSIENRDRSSLLGGLYLTIGTIVHCYSYMRYILGTGGGGEQGH